MKVSLDYWFGFIEEEMSFSAWIFVAELDLLTLIFSRESKVIPRFCLYMIYLLWSSEERFSC